jgi:hypothetical protein
MATLHGLLSRIPQDLPFEKLLVESQLLYEEFPPHSIKEIIPLSQFVSASVPDLCLQDPDP